MSRKGTQLTFYCTECKTIHLNTELKHEPTGVFEDMKKHCRKYHKKYWHRMYLDK